MLPSAFPTLKSQDEQYVTLVMSSGYPYSFRSQNISGYRMAVSIHQELCQSFKYLKLSIIWLSALMHTVFWLQPLFKKVVLQVSGLSSFLCKGLGSRKKEICWDLCSLPVFLKLLVFCLYPSCLMIWISLFWQAHHFPSYNGFYYAFYLELNIILI